MRPSRKLRRREHEPKNAMTDASEIARFYDRASPLMRELLEALARARSVRDGAAPAAGDAAG